MGTHTPVGDLGRTEPTTPAIDVCLAVTAHAKQRRNAYTTPVHRTAGPRARRHDPWCDCGGGRTTTGDSGRTLSYNVVLASSASVASPKGCEMVSTSNHGHSMKWPAKRDVRTRVCADIQAHPERTCVTCVKPPP